MKKLPKIALDFIVKMRLWYRQKSSMDKHMLSSKHLKSIIVNETVAMFLIYVNLL